MSKRAAWFVGFILVVLPWVARCHAAPQSNVDYEIKAFCIDFNWGAGGPNGFARPGLWADADPAEHVAWYKGLGVSVIQTFCVSCNGYAWYKNGFVPPQPALKDDILPDVVRLGHEKGLMVMAYICAGANGNTNIRLCQSGCIVDAIPYHSNPLAFFLKLLNFVSFIFREYIGYHTINPRQLGNSFSCFHMVTGNHGHF